MPDVIDPIRSFIDGRIHRTGGQPTPLASTSYDVRVVGGLAIVRMTRTFRNEEAVSIEAVLTFPVPIHAVLFDLRVRIDGRLLQARAEAKTAARASYEAGIEAGHTSVLHEEVLRGVHMLSVGHIPPGTEIEVETVFALSVSLAGGQPRLRIPLTVGEVYGYSGLSDVDDLRHGGERRLVDLAVTTDSGTPALIGGSLVDGRARVPNDRPIDIEIRHWRPQPVAGVSAEGRRVLLEVVPAPTAAAPLDVAILVDRSGSMKAPFSALVSVTKHEAVQQALAEAFTHLEAGDRVELWEFDNHVDRVGTMTDPGRAADVVAALGPPRGGTEIGMALERVMRESAARTIVVITDGNSHALDVAALAAAGKRCIAVLVGEDSLEATIGHLAATTGGDLLVTDARAPTERVAAALALARTPYGIVRGPVDGSLDISVGWGGAQITTQWQDDPGPVPAEPEQRAVAAFAISLVLPRLPTETSAPLAAAEGIAGPLTSLVLVDTEGARLDALPALRKVSLPSPATDRKIVLASAPRDEERIRQIEAKALRKLRIPGRMRKLPSVLDEDPPMYGLSPARLAAGRPSSDIGPGAGDLADRLAAAASAIHWGISGDALARADLKHLRDGRDAVLEAARLPEILAAAQALGMEPLSLVIALLARLAAPRNRFAARVAVRLLGDPEPAAVAPLVQKLGLRQLDGIAAG